MRRNDVEVSGGPPRYVDIDVFNHEESCPNGCKNGICLLPRAGFCDTCKSLELSMHEEPLSVAELAKMIRDPQGDDASPAPANAPQDDVPDHKEQPDAPNETVHAGAPERLDPDDDGGNPAGDAPDIDDNPLPSGFDDDEEKSDEFRIIPDTGQTEEEKEADKKLRSESFKLMANIGSFGLFLAIALVFCYVIGNWMDKLFDTKPVFLIFWIACGIASSILEFVRNIKKARKLALDGQSEDEKK